MEASGRDTGKVREQLAAPGSKNADRVTVTLECCQAPKYPPMSEKENSIAVAESETGVKNCVGKTKPRGSPGQDVFKERSFPALMMVLVYFGTDAELLVKAVVGCVLRSLLANQGPISARQTVRRRYKTDNFQ